MENKQYSIYVYFNPKNKDIVNQTQINLTQNDYSSIEFDFIFDREDGTKVFELRKPDGTYWVKEIPSDNKLVIEDLDENEQPLIVLNQYGTYKYEISLYNGDKKLTTSSVGSFYVRKELVNVNDDEIAEDDRLPILDNLIDDVTEKISDVDAALTDLQQKVDSGYFKGDTGEQGPQGPQGPAGQNGQDGQNGADGQDGVIQYTAGDNITIENNVISASGGSSNVVFMPNNITTQEKIGILQEVLEIYQSGEKPLLILTNNSDTGQIPVFMTVTSYDENSGNGSITLMGLGISPSSTNTWNGISYNSARQYIFVCAFSNNQIYNLEDYNDVCGYLINDITQNYAGYDASKTQILKNVNGSIQWVDE